MSTQIFLHIEVNGKQILGEATTEHYQGKIEVENFSWGMSAEGSPRTGRGNTSSRATFDHLNIIKYFDLSSVSLTRCMTTRKKYDKVQLIVDQHLNHVRPVLKKRNPVLVINLSDGYIEDVGLSMSEASKSGMIREQVSLSFRKLVIYYWPASPDHDLRLPPVSFSGETSAFGD